MGFPRLLSIFYCTFHPIQGPKVLYEVPEGSILSKTSPLVDFDSISEYLIPKVELCSKLVTISTPTCKVIGFPINLEHKKFQRNALMFNLAFVFDKDAEISSYEPVVRKMARVLKALEKENEFLSKQTRLLMMDHPTSVNNALPPPPPSTPAATLLQNSTSNIATTATTVAAASSANTATPTPTTAAVPTSVPSSSATAAVAESTESTENTENTEKLGKIERSEPTSSPELTNSENDSKRASGTLTPPIDISPNTSILPTALPPLPADGSTITSTVLVSSPPSMTSNSIATVITAPPSSSPFPLSKSTSSGSNHSATGGSLSAPNSMPKAVTSASTVPAPTLLEQAQMNGSGMQNLIEQLIEDLNSYCECQIPIDSANTINLKLFPTYTNPAPVYDYQVPISTVNLEALTDVNWDMTMQRITGYINGVNSVKRIAEYADVETGLARMCMQHLLYYGCIIMVDLFQFKNIYAVKLEMMRLTEDVALQCECVSYVTLPDMHAPSFAKIFSLYCSLQYGVVLQDWIEQNQIIDYNIDVRRFISFGVIKGFLYRVHKYPILDYYDHNSVTGAGLKTEQDSSSITPLSLGVVNQNGQPAPGVSSTVLTATPATTAVPSISSRPGTLSATMTSTQRKMYGDTLAPTDQNTYSANNNYPQSQLQSSNDAPHPAVVIPPALRKLLNGQHHYDELCTQFGCSVRELDLILATDSRIKFIYR